MFVAKGKMVVIEEETILQTNARKLGQYIGHIIVDYNLK